MTPLVKMVSDWRFRRSQDIDKCIRVDGSEVDTRRNNTTVVTPYTHFPFYGSRRLPSPPLHPVAYVKKSRPSPSRARASLTGAFRRTAISLFSFLLLLFASTFSVAHVSNVDGPDNDKEWTATAGESDFGKYLPFAALLRGFRVLTSACTRSGAISVSVLFFSSLGLLGLPGLSLRYLLPRLCRRLWGDGVDNGARNVGGFSPWGRRRRGMEKDDYESHHAEFVALYPRLSSTEHSRLILPPGCRRIPPISPRKTSALDMLLPHLPPEMLGRRWDEIINLTSDGIRMVGTKGRASVKAVVDMEERGGLWGPAARMVRGGVKAGGAVRDRWEKLVYWGVRKEEIEKDNDESSEEEEKRHKNETILEHPLPLHRYSSTRSRCDCDSVADTDERHRTQEYEGNGRDDGRCEETPRNIPQHVTTELNEIVPTVCQNSLRRKLAQMVPKDEDDNAHKDKIYVLERLSILPPCSPGCPCFLKSSCFQNTKTEMTSLSKSFLPDDTGSTLSSASSQIQATNTPPPQHHESDHPRSLSSSPCGKRRHTSTRRIATMTTTKHHQHLHPPQHFFDAEASAAAIDALSAEVPDRRGYLFAGLDAEDDNEHLTPLLVFVNSRSGGSQGRVLIPQLRRLLNPIQIWDLAEGGPDPVLESFSVLRRLRILVCGGDGTVSWILDAVERLSTTATEGTLCPPIAILPLGTGNDLANIHGWGGGYNNESPLDLLQQVSEAYVSMLDRWEIKIEPNLPKNERGGAERAISTPTHASHLPHVPPLTLSPSTVEIKTFNNYFGIGTDAQAALQFHDMRENAPFLFFSRIINKLWYGILGAENALQSPCIDLPEVVSLEANGVPVPLPLDCQGLLVLNIDSYAGGTPLWSTGSKSGSLMGRYSFEQDEAPGRRYSRRLCRSSSPQRRR
mmetsp:Transcript_36159/g.84530  ORF Transcript_36159/g.84530 Transcript_36159/m.84530 type:complete len:907 (+) Transcript_36159:389-3109(+)